MKDTLLKINQDCNCEDYRYYDTTFLKLLADVPLNQIAKDYGCCVAEAVRGYFLKYPSERYKEILGKR